MQHDLLQTEHAAVDDSKVRLFQEHQKGVVLHEQQDIQGEYGKRSWFSACR